MARRIRWLGVGMVVCFLILFLQLNNLQVLKASQYANAARNPAHQLQEYDQPRGFILSADGQTLAESVPAPKGSLWKYERKYPERYAALFAQIVGVDSLDYGTYGVEASYNSYLVAHNRPVTTLKDLLTTSPPITDTVTLTLSTQLQADARAALADRVGSIVVLDPITGAVLAMYSNPTFDPNPLASLSGATEKAAFAADNAPDFLDYRPFTSEAYQDNAFPGSTFKIVTTAAAYDHAPQLVNTPIQYYTCIPPGTFQGQTTKLCNFGDGGCGGTIATMLPPSCDTGYAVLGTKIGATSMLAEAESFGFNQQPPIDLPPSPNEISDFLQPSCYQNAQVYLAFSSIGQFCTKASPLQMAMVAAGIADDGVIMTPHVMAEIRDSDGNLVESYQPKSWLRATSPATATAINGLMHQVVEVGTASGVGFPAADDVAAKTGTAQVQNSAGQYIATNDWMIAFAPATAPRVAIAVELPNQPVSGTGAEQAGPVMKTMIEAALAETAGP
jgi:peptidoglycan glycosyltransferase